MWRDNVKTKTELIDHDRIYLAGLRCIQSAMAIGSGLGRSAKSRKAVQGTSLIYYGKQSRPLRGTGTGSSDDLPANIAFRVRR
jgi:hypothetical protein